MGEMEQTLRDFVERLKTAAGANVESVILYGSASRGDADETYSDLNLMCILRDAGGAELAKIAPVVRWWSVELRQRPPLFVTAEELRTSADVFAIEMLDVKANRRILDGSDLLAGLTVPMNLHRVQVEHDLRTVHLKLRQHYLFTTDEQELGSVLAKSTSSVMTLLRHALIAVDEPVASHSKRALIDNVGTVFQVNVGPLHAALDLREGRRLETSVSNIYGLYLQSLALVIRNINNAAPKSELKRVGKESI